MTPALRIVPWLETRVSPRRVQGWTRPALVVKHRPSSSVRDPATFHDSWQDRYRFPQPVPWPRIETESWLNALTGRYHHYNGKLVSQQRQLFQYLAQELLIVTNWRGQRAVAPRFDNLTSRADTHDCLFKPIGRLFVAIGHLARAAARFPRIASGTACTGGTSTSESTMSEGEPRVEHGDGVQTAHDSSALASQRSLVRRPSGASLARDWGGAAYDGPCIKSSIAWGFPRFPGKKRSSTICVDWWSDGKIAL